MGGEGGVVGVPHCPVELWLGVGEGGEEDQGSVELVAHIVSGLVTKLRLDDNDINIASVQ